MSVGLLREFEKQAIRLLTIDRLSEEALLVVLRDYEFVDYEYTGAGYYFTIKHSALPIERAVCSTPWVRGRADGIGSGFIVFLEHGTLTLECHSEDTNVPENYRDLDVEISAI